jgi:hypothetical protein
VVRLAGDAPSFVAAIEAALADARDRHEVARRRAAAAPMGWEAQVDRLEALLEPLLDRESGLPRIAS